MSKNADWWAGGSNAPDNLELLCKIIKETPHLNELNISRNFVLYQKAYKKVLQEIMKKDKSHPKMLNLKVGGNFEYAEGNRTAISPLCKLLQKGVRRLKYLDFSDNWNNETEFKKCLKAIRKGSLMQSLEELKLGGLGGSFLFSMKYFGMELAKIVEAA